MRALRSVPQIPDNWDAQMWAADALAEIGAAARPAVPELIACLKSDTRYVATSSAKALGKIGPDAVSAVPALTAQVEESDDHYTRVCMARALWRINRSGRSLPVLHDAIASSRDSMAVSEAARAMGEMGAQATGSLALLRPLLKDGNSFVRNAAAEALKQFDRQ